ncbi:Pumilio-family RNA binding protein repeat protein [Sporothrix schenckii 1099-18]|uniref:Pumilio-family RNA binding protein repeat protein n=1 Tax=Sporothrix schenckii 1099-18 TaxID=1397361 RepID=A0A0F2MC97_SPOSC|nr:Pumilio-family RNA binding protein repeat protein [Sporothrix schenckii 1099-18]KJR87333.1 Pumilio-family RNA binding protein repeat protein [Sporothrix schenckii 1099-18]
MSPRHSTGSPLRRHNSGSQGFGQDENSLGYPDNHTVHSSQNSLSSMRGNVVTLTTNKLANQMGPKKTHESSTSPTVYPMDTLLAKLSEQQAAIREQNDGLKQAEEDASFARAMEQQQGCSSLPITPGINGLQGSSALMLRSSSANQPESSDEVLRLKLQLAHAQNKINILDNELANTCSIKSDPSQALSLANTDPDFPSVPLPDQIGPPGMIGFRAPSAARPLFNRENIWAQADEPRLETLDNPTGSIGRARSMWRDDIKQGGFQQSFPNGPSSVPIGTGPYTSQPASIWPPSRPGHQAFFDANLPGFSNTQGALDDSRGRMTPDTDLLLRPQRPGNRSDSRNPNTQAFNGYSNFNAGQVLFDTNPGFLTGGSGPNMNNNSLGMFPQFQQPPIGTPLSPHATEFNTDTASSWKEKYIVDKIVSSNDQQASIFLQQKLKVGTSDQKYDIVEAIAAQAYPLMINRFGNFLVQRCFEHGSPEQIVKIAEAIRGNTLSLSMDPFGCHVVQKAFDSVPEDYKAIMVHELLRRIPETVIHRYACHVWQKLFELRWNDSPPQIMKYVNEALCGMWHEVALGETGSLVVQNIFENCLEEDKRPCIEEVLGNIDIVAHGQFGNWCIQHICEHGAPGDRGRAIDHVIQFAAEYSMDQFASKVVEKCLKIGGADFLGRYLDRVCEGRVDRPRIPLIDIASDQYGNYLIQYILTHASTQHREVVAAHIRKHMVSLRGSKFGSRVGMLCTNPAVATRPGPGIGPSVGRLPPRYAGAPPSRHRAAGAPGLYNGE